jgi:hypothetical protein
MLHQERFGACIADQKNLHAQFAKAVMGDGWLLLWRNGNAAYPVPQNDYIDDNAEKLSRQEMRSDAVKRQFAIHG